MVDPDSAPYDHVGEGGSEDDSISSASSEAIHLLSAEPSLHNHASLEGENNQGDQSVRDPTHTIEQRDFENVVDPPISSENNSVDLEQPLHNAHPQDGQLHDESSPSTPALPHSTPDQQRSLNSGSGACQAPQTLGTSSGLATPESAGKKEDTQSFHTAGHYSWLPLTLRWPYLFSLSVVSLGLGALTLSLTIFSIKNNGLRDNDDSTLLFFDWRFSPTLVAVIYSLMLSSLLLDIRRTESYSRLSNKKGSSGSASILFSLDRHWWSDPMAALSRDSNGRNRSWAYFLASVCNILGFLIISPLSSALVAPASIQISDPSSFSQMNLLQVPQEPIVDDDTYFQVISSYLLGVTTSAWITNDSIIAPIWPSGSNGPPFGPTLTNQSQDWYGSTMVIQADLDCKPLLLEEFHNVSRPCVSQFSDGKPYNTYANFTKVTLKSQDGCIAEYNANAMFQNNSTTTSTFGELMSDVGGGWWANISQVFDEKSCDVDEPSMLIKSTFRPDSDSICNQDSIILIQTPLWWNRTSDFSVRAEACRSSFYSANVDLSISNSATTSTVLFDERSFRRDRKPLDLHTLGIPDFHSSFFTSDWQKRMRSPDQANPSILTAGPLPILAAFYKLDGNAIRASPNLVRNAQQLHHRFFAERVQSAMKNLDTDSSAARGKVTSVSSRIIVNPGIGLALGVLLLLITAALQMIFLLTRPNRRPLNLSRDPSTAASTASALADESPEIVEIFNGADRQSAKWLKSRLGTRQLKLRRGNLLLFDANAATTKGR
ncbi:MAG: hypothetical protein Q9227_000776 [Pyrenula ochraceoflavens]